MEEELNLDKKIEAILFYASEPTSLSFLSKTLETEKDEVMHALEELSNHLKARGIKLLENNEEYMLVTAPEYSELIEKMIKEEREKDLGRAGLETLTIIAYKGPVTRKEIDYIREVNSQYVLRNLLLRGLIDRRTNKFDERQVVYTVTADTVKFLGLNRISDLPEFEQARTQIEEGQEIEESIKEDGR